VERGCFCSPTGQNSWTSFFVRAAVAWEEETSLDFVGVSKRLRAGINIERLAGSFDSLEVGEEAAKQAARQQEKEFRPRGYSAGDKDKGRLASILSFGRKNRKDQSNSSSLDSMTAGSSLLKSFAWPLKAKKRHRSGSGGSKEFEQKTKKSLSVQQQRKLTGRKTSSVDSFSSSSLEIVAPSSSDVEFKYSWPIDGFIHQVKTCKADGLDSKNFEINVNGVLTIWNLSVRFWMGEHGERLANPFVLCLNLVGCRVEGRQEVAVKYKFGIYNRCNEEFEMGTPEKVMLKLEQQEKLQSIGYKNIALSDKHVNASGDVMLLVRLSIIKKEEPCHSLSSDLGSLINDEASSDLILEAGERRFRVHRNILAARSPVFASLLTQLEQEMKAKEEEKEEGRGKERRGLGQERIEEETEEDVTCEEAEVEAVPKVVEGERQGIKKELEEKPLEAVEDPKEDGEREKKAVTKLVIENLPGDTVEELLRYIYTDNSNNVDLFSQTLLAASDIYQLPGLKVQCEKHLGETINPVNVAEILLLSDSYSCQHLKKAALSYCSENHSYIMKDSQWKIIEEENPKLYSQAISEIAPEECSKHVECIKRGGNRYETEKENAASGKKKHSVLKKYSQ